MFGDPEITEMIASYDDEEGIIVIEEGDESKPVSDFFQEVARDPTQEVRLISGLAACLVLLSKYTRYTEYYDQGHIMTENTQIGVSIRSEILDVIDTYGIDGDMIDEAISLTPSRLHGRLRRIRAKLA